MEAGRGFTEEPVSRVDFYAADHGHEEIGSRCFGCKLVVQDG